MKKQGFLYGSAVLVASALIVKAIGAVFRIPLANMLGGTGMGYFSAAYGIFMPVYAIAVTGLPAAVARSVSMRVVRGENPGIVRKKAFILFGAAGMAAMIILLLAAYPFCKFISGETAAVPAVIAIAPSIPAGCLAAVCRGYCEGHRDMYPTAISQVAEAVAKLVFGLALCMAVTGGLIRINSSLGSAGVTAYAAAAAVAGITASSFVGLVFVLFMGGKKTYEKTSAKDERGLYRELLHTAVPAALGALVINLTSLIDLVTIMRSLRIISANCPDAFSDLTDKGVLIEDVPNFIYGSFTGLAVTIFNLIPSLTNMFGKSMLPAAAAAKASGDNKRLGECSMGVMLACALIAVPSGFGIAALSRQVLEFLFLGRTAEIEVCVLPLKILGVAIPFVCISSAAFAVLQAAGKAEIPVKIMGLGAGVKLMGNLLLTARPGLNVLGAALSTLICYIVIGVMSVIAMKKYASFEISPFMSYILRIILSGLLCAAAAYFTYSAFEGIIPERLDTIISCLSGAIIYIISTYFSGIISKSTLKMLIS